jgi:hypothetical protein
MDTENVIVQFELDDSVIYITRRDYLNTNYKKITEYIFSYGTLSGATKLKNSTHRSISAAMRKFNKAVDAIKNGTKIK